MHWSVLSVIVTILTHVRGVDYCKFTQEHVLCGSPSFSPECGEVIDKNTKVPKEMQKRIVKAFNTYRNKVAGGEVSVNDGPLPQAANIVELVWDDELAAVAEGHAKHCQFEHSCDKCRQVERFGNGENLYSGLSSDDSMLNTSWEEIIDPWTVGEEKFLYAEDAQNFPKLNKGGFEFAKFGHLTQAIWAETKYVGCSKIAYRPEQSSSLNLLAVCTLGPVGNYLEQKIYIQGKPCTMCPHNSKCSATYPNLCKLEKQEYGESALETQAGGKSGPETQASGNSGSPSSNCIHGLTFLPLLFFPYLFKTI